MKKLYCLIVIVLISSLVLTGCLLSNLGQVPTSEQSGITYLSKHTVDDPYVTDLLAGQDILVGTVNVWNDAHNLYVEYELDDGWCMTESHLAVATSLTGIPQTKKGNPIPGKFEYGDNYDPCASGDTFTILLTSLGGGGTQLFIAAHAVVWDKSSETTIEVVSGTDTDVTAVDGVPVVQKAVRAYEPGVGVPYPNCPTGDNDVISSLWDQNAKLLGGSMPNWMGADWIWSTDYSTDPVNGEYVDFSAPFEIPGLPVGGTLTITADNAYSASLNGVPVGSSISLGPGFPSTLKEKVDTMPQVGDWGVASQGWQLVEVWSLTGLTSGSNVLTVRAANEYMDSDDKYKGWNNSAQTYTTSVVTDPNGSYRCINPAGLIFKASVDYYARSETAWADGTGFPGKNWATYFNYTVQPTLNLYEKTGDPDWNIVSGGAWGNMTYNPSGNLFNFDFEGHGLQTSTGYTLIYYPDPWPGNGLICLGSGTTDGLGDVSFTGSVNTGDLPFVTDDNYPGAKIWLVLSSHVNCTLAKMVGWDYTKYLFENNLITFDDVDVP